MSNGQTWAAEQDEKEYPSIKSESIDECDCDKLRTKLRQKTEFCRTCGGDALKEIEQLNCKLSITNDECRVLARATLAHCNPSHWQDNDDHCKRFACVLARKVLG